MPYIHFTEEQKLRASEVDLVEFLRHQREKPRKEFALPSAGQEMRRMYAYLLKHRFLDRNMVNAFVRAGLLYESCGKFKDREFHNAVFVGRDENGVPRHTHKRSLNSRTAALAEQTHNVLKPASRPGIRSEAEKRELTEGLAGAGSILRQDIRQV